ncbi:MAG: IS66 family transposase [Candidatus Omnitrophica bacterium]|nr:IS66 family transposase [Candidatus Omnitrophota bacterium]MBU4478549.1 IS66 family transposase [Candidatus Omnitrophota bacterium]MCG2702854.1 IS66 family transposase [Candidatus Omnitrophota bacterium]
MKLNTNDIDAILNKAGELLEKEKISVVLKTTITLLIAVVKLLSDRLGLNSRNSSKPPSSDPNRKKNRRAKSDKKSGGQKGHKGTTLEQIEKPDNVEKIEIDRRTIPAGEYKECGVEKRQVFDINIFRIVTEYQAQILEDKKTGRQFVASFPEGVTQAVQYGDKVKAHAVYMSQYQLLPYRRIQEYFSAQLDIPLSEGTLFNFNQEAYVRLEGFEEIIKNKLIDSEILHVDETSVNVNGDRNWLHCASNISWTHFFAHEKRGNEATDFAGILPLFKGILCHDHWKPYFCYTKCLHSLCNAHHLRELERAWEHDKQSWAKEMKDFLEKVHRAVSNSSGKLEGHESNEYWKGYRDILKKAEIECPAPEEKIRRRKRGRLKRSKARNLLERLINYQEDVLRFMSNEKVPFTNNQGENDIRMTKVQQKISGCFRSMIGAKIFCRVRGYLSTCRKQGVTSSQAMELLFKGELPKFAM